ncbi:hypothetical protein F4819DRAFT_123533 [Hypoxylon fuscum]|nr:hypothetical protein F4819DRAFT_123533 [Hypoxylon fuscum]
MPSPANPTIFTPVAPSPTTSSFDDAENTFQSNSDTFNKTATAITTGWIVGIVFIVLSVIVAGILVIYIYRRNQKRRRMAQYNGEPKPNWPTNMPGGGLQPPPHSGSSPATSYGQPSELAGQGPPPRYEIPNTEVLAREMPNNEVARPPPRHEMDSTQRSELPV